MLALLFLLRLPFIVLKYPWQCIRNPYQVRKHYCLAPDFLMPFLNPAPEGISILIFFLPRTNCSWPRSSCKWDNLASTLLCMASYSSKQTAFEIYLFDVCINISLLCIGELYFIQFMNISHFAYPFSYR